MMVVPRDEHELNAMFSFLHEFAGVSPTADMHVIGWVDNNQLRIVCGINGWLGKVCQIHIAFAPDWHFSPREMLRSVFRYAFVKCKRELVLGIVNSKNAKAMRFDEHLGFKELYRIPGMHDEGGDIVVLGMRKEACRYIGDEPVMENEHAAGHA